jgi:catechol 2,3-dioxygenase-like lactoylglutathione lyase family enzyme
MVRGISHVALSVEDVPAAAYYRALFGLEVAFRDVQHRGRQASLRPAVDWAEGKAHGVAPGLSSLFRDGLTLALEQGAVAGAGALNHTGLDVDQSEFELIRGRVAHQGCQVVAQRADLLVFADRYGLRWEIATASYDSPADASTGARFGEWLAVDDARYARP